MVYTGISEEAGLKKMKDRITFITIINLKIDGFIYFDFKLFHKFTTRIYNGIFSWLIKLSTGKGKFQHEKIHCLTITTQPFYVSV